MHVLETNRRDVTSRVGSARHERTEEEKYTWPLWACWWDCGTWVALELGLSAGDICGDEAATRHPIDRAGGLWLRCILQAISGWRSDICSHPLLWLPHPAFNTFGGLVHLQGLYYAASSHITIHIAFTWRLCGETCFRPWTCLVPGL